MEPNVESKGIVAAAPPQRLAQWALVGAGAVIFVLLLLTDRAALKSARSSEGPAAAAQPAASPLAPPPLAGVALPPLPPGAEAQAVSRLAQQLEQAPAAERATVLDRLVAASLNVARPDLAAGYQDALAEQAPAAQRAAATARALQLYIEACAQAAALQLSPEAAQALNARGLALAQAQLAAAPNDLDAQVGRALLHVHSGDPARIMPQGIQALAEIAKKNPEHLGAGLALGRFALQTGQLDRALQRLTTVLQQHPGQPEASLVMSEVLLRMKKPTDARRVIEAALARTDDPMWTAKLQQALAQAGS